ncbi:CDP-alcohol phosphatidyltransferase family protein [bacterium]|nr:CDP-alcohol phosphatidyltransferase family protein [bacterium]
MQRRELTSRGTWWARGLAAWLTRKGFTPNSISMLSIAFAGLVGLALLAIPDSDGVLRRVLFVVAAAGIQMRLICNLMDGMVAVEGGKGTPAGELFNDLPDRFSDVFILVPLGYAAGHSVVGWIAAIVALLVAYVRVLGGSTGLNQEFLGPMAKQHRMAVVTLACLLCAALPVTSFTANILTWALWIIIVGGLLTIGRRAARIHRQLMERS